MRKKKSESFGVPKKGKIKHIMKKAYEINGMTCNGCRNHVEDALLSVAGVANVSVDLKEGEALVESQFEVPVENLQEALKNNGDQYEIQPKNKVG